MHTAPEHDPAPNRVQRALREAGAHALSGLVVGGLVAALVVGTTMLFPGLHEYSRDLGLALAYRFEHIAGTFGGGLELRPGEKHAYAFVDLDPIPRPGPPGTPAGTLPAPAGREYTEACLAVTRPEPQRALAACDPRLPIDRRLLAQVIGQVAAAGPRAIVVDVLIERTLAQDEEADRRLRDQLAALSGRVLWLPAPAPEGIFLDAARRPSVKLDAAALEGLVPAATPKGVPYPEPDQPVRRYPRCFADLASPGRWVPSLPFGTAEALRQEKADAQDLRCLPAKRPPRIHYTLASLADDGAGALGVREEEGSRESLYRDVYRRCTVSALARRDDDCSGSALKGRVVVIGASNPVRRDRHYTPLGDMAGSELVINAMRSFALYPDAHEPDALDRWLHECLVVAAVAGLVWLPFHLSRALWPAGGAAAGPPASRARALAMRLRAAAAGTARYLVFVALALGITLYASVSGSATPDVDLLLPALAVALESIIDVMAALHATLLGWMARLTGLPHEASHG